MNLTNKELAKMLRSIADNVEKCNENEVAKFHFDTQLQELHHGYDIVSLYQGMNIELKFKVY